MVVLALLLVTPLLFAGGAQESGEASQEPIVLKYAHVGVPGEIQTRYAEELAKAIESKTDGRVVLQVYPNSQLGGVSEMVRRNQVGRHRYGPP